MKSQQEILDKLNQTISTKPSKWLEEADYRFENKAWLQKSQAIALRILRDIRAKGISQKDLAEKLNVSPQQVNRWVKGNENLSLETISKIECALNIELITVLGTSEKSKDKQTFDVEYSSKLNVLEIIQTDSEFLIEG